MDRVAVDTTFLIDLWIACTAKAEDVPILTRNVADFRRVPGLVALDYADRGRATRGS